MVSLDELFDLVARKRWVTVGYAAKALNVPESEIMEMIPFAVNFRCVRYSKRRRALYWACRTRRYYVRRVDVSRISQEAEAYLEALASASLADGD